MHSSEDPENPKEQVFQDSLPKTGDLTSSAFFIEAAALLTLWSVLVINEGAIRVMDRRPVDGFGGIDPPAIVPFLAALGEVLFGMIGLVVGIAGFIFRWYNANVTKLAMIAQTLLGYFVFAVYVFVIPIFQITNLDNPRPPSGDLTLGQDKFLIALGVIVSFNFCLALQGGQFVFFARMICGGSGSDFLKQRSGNRMRAMFWNGNMGMAGVFTIITGALIQANLGGGRLPEGVFFASPPNVGKLPGLTIATGVFMVLWAIVGIVLALGNKPAPSAYFIGTFVIYLLAYLNFTIVQLGLLPFNDRPFPSQWGGPTALHGGLVFMVVFLGPYFVHQAGKEHME